MKKTDAANYSLPLAVYARNWCSWGWSPKARKAMRRRVGREMLERYLEGGSRKKGSIKRARLSCLELTFTNFLKKTS